MAARKRKPTNSTRNGTVDPSKPLAKPSRELFAQDVAAGVPVKDAYVRAGYRGNDVSRYELRRCADIDARVNCLLRKRIECDTRARHKAEKPIADLELRTLRELEKIAFSDARDLVSWDRVPVYDDDGTVTGYRDELMVTPSHHLTSGAAAAVKSVTTKFGSMKFDMHDKLTALQALCKALGIYQDAALAPSVTVNQLNVGSDNALEAARRVAFALALAQHQTEQAAKLEAKTIEGDKAEETSAKKDD